MSLPHPMRLPHPIARSALLSLRSVANSAAPLSAFFAPCALSNLLSDLLSALLSAHGRWYLRPA